MQCYFSAIFIIAASTCNQSEPTQNEQVKSQIAWPIQLLKINAYVEA